MPEGTQATFTDQLELTVDLKTFKSSLDEARQIYQKFMSDLGSQAEQVLSVGLFAGLKQQVETVLSEVKVVSEASLKSAQEAQQGVSSIVEALGEKAEQQAQREIAASNKAAQVQVENAKKIAEAKKAAFSGVAIDDGQFQGKQAYKVPNADGSTRLTTDLGVASDKTGILAEIEGAQQAEEALKEKRYLDDLAAAEREAKFAQQQQADIQKLGRMQESAAADDAKRTAAKQEAVQKLGNMQAAAEAEDVKRTAAKQEAIQKLGNMQTAAQAEDLRREQEKQDEIQRTGRMQELAAQQNQQRDQQRGQMIAKAEAEMDAALAARQRKAEAATINRQSIGDEVDNTLEKNQAAFNRELEKTDSLSRKIDFASYGKDLKGLLDALRQRLAEVQEQTTRLRASMQNMGPSMTGDQELEAAKALNKLKTEELELRNRINSVQAQSDRQNRSFFDFVNGGWAQTAAHMLKVYAIWEAIMLIQNAVVATIKAPFDAIAEGVKYTRDLEKTADELMGVLGANVKYSDDLAENFSKLREAAEGAAAQLQNIAIYTHAPLDSVERTFKALMDNGISKYTKNMSEVLSMTTMFAAALRVAGLGGLQLNQQIATIPQLMDGTVNSGNRFLRVLNLTPVAWNQILQSAREHHDLVTQLAPKMEPYLNALEKGKVHQAVLLEQFDLLKKRLEAAATIGFYEKMSDALRSMNEWMSGEGGASVLEFLKLTADGIVQIATALYTFAQSFKVFDVLKVQLLGLMTVLQGVSNLMTRASNAVAENANTEQTKDLEYKLGFATGNFKGGIAKGQQYPTTAQPGDTQDIINLRNQLREAYKDYVGIKQKILEDNLKMAEAEEGLKHFAEGTSDPKVQDAMKRWKEALDSLFTDTSRKDLPKLDLEPLVNMLQKAYQAYQDTDEAIKQSSDARRKKVEQDISANVISHAEAAEKIKQITADEAARRLQAWTEYEAKYKDLRTRIANTPTSDKAEEDKKRNRLAQLDIQHERESRSFQKEQNGTNDQYLNALRASLSEEDAIRREHTKYLLDLKKQQGKQELELARQQYQDGYLTAVEYFDKEVEAAKNEHNASVAALQQELDSTGSNTLRHKELLDKLALEDQQYTEKVKLSALQRESALYKEFLSRQKYFDDLRKLVLEAEQIIAESSHGVGMSTSLDLTNSVYADKQREIQQLEREKQIELDIAKLRNSGTETVRKLTLELQALNNQELAAYAEQYNKLSNRTNSPFLNSVLVRGLDQQTMVSLRNREYDAYNAYSSANLAITAKGPGYKQTPEETAQIEALAEAYHTAAAKVGDFASVMESHRLKFGQGFDYFTRKLLGFDWSDIKAAWKQAIKDQSTGEKVGVVSTVIKGLADAITNISSTYQQGKQSGGTLGGVGAVFGSFGSAIPGWVGQAMGAIGSVLGMVGSLFTAAAKKIAEDAKKKFQDTIDALNAGNATLIQTINSLEAQRNETIMRLSGKKGGQDQLDQLLPEFDKEIESLKKQAEQTIQQFNDQLDNLRLQSDTLSQINQQWQQINQQIKDYIGAGGDAAKAQEYLSLQLQKMQADAQKQLAEGEQTAIQDAMQLNDLLTQRNKLTDDYSKKVFDLENADAIERRQSGAVSRAPEIAQAKQDYEQQLQSLDSQISLTGQKVDLEKQVFNIASDTAALQQRSNELTIQSLQQQILQWQDLKKIIDGITVDSSGLFTAQPGLFTSPVSIGTISITVTTPSTDELPGDIADQLSQELQRRLRFSPSL